MLSCEVKAKFLRGFSDKTRLQILDSLREGERSVSQIVAEVDGNQSNISQHLACLKGCGIIRSRQEGKYSYYSLSGDEVGALLDMIDRVYAQVDTDVKSCERNEQLNL